MSSKTMQPEPSAPVDLSHERGVEAGESPSQTGAPPETGPTETAIRERAYELWERAGAPEDRAWEFWLEAERELQEETHP